MKLEKFILYKNDIKRCDHITEQDRREIWNDDKLAIAKSTPLS